MSSRTEIPSIVLQQISAGHTILSSATDILSIRRNAEPQIVAHLVASSKVRTKIWELHHSLHCSIVGTCLTTGDLRRLLVRLKVQGADSPDDHRVHQLGVMLAGSPKAGAKHLQKTLDRRHGRALDQFAKAKDAASLGTLWDDALKRGDIPGAYWSVLTHPAMTETLVKRVFGEIHMLSHLVGAANRADIRRLRQLEEDNAALAAKLERQQKQLRDGFMSRDDAIRRLGDALARKAGDEVDASSDAAASETGTLAQALAERDKRLVREIARRERLEIRLEKVAAERDAAKRALGCAERECDGLRAELAAVESRIGTLLPGDDENLVGALNLHGLTVLYVGGRAHQTPQLKGLVEQVNGRFLHHDGGIEHNAALLPGLVSRADLAVFPVDCVSHDAVAALKRTCRQLGKRYLPLRTSSLTSLLSGIMTNGSGTAPNPTRN